MSQKLLSLSPDLLRLREEGYWVQLRGGLLLIRGVPYVNEKRQVLAGTLISALDLAGDHTRRPSTHVVYFDGEYPCTSDGVKLGIANESRRQELAPGVVAQYSFSQKPEGGYEDYYHKMTTYAAMLAAPARVINPNATPRLYAASGDEDPESVFEYLDSASGRVGLGVLVDRLSAERLAIIGLGGTGSYILDLTAKTPVQQIRLFDDDEFLNHNAFRAPGAPSIQTLREVPLKVDYFSSIYARVHRGIIAHPVKLGPANLRLLDGVTFAFVSMDEGSGKIAVVEKLEEIGASFIDVGMGLALDGGSLGGILRMTASTPERRDVLRSRVSFAAGVEENLYASNIQVADLNCLNAALAVAKWKRMRGFYRDLEREHHATYTTDGNLLVNCDPG